MTENDQAILYPGTEVELTFDPIVEGGEERKMTAIVYPVSFSEMQEFTKVLLKMTDVVSTMENVMVPTELKEAADAGVPEAKKAIDKEITKATIKALAPFLITECMDLVKGCVKGVNVEVLAHWHIAPIIEAWITENFGSLGKLQPWIQAIDNLITQATGESPNLWETVSDSWSEVDFSSLVSSMKPSPASPTEDGASPSSTTSSGTPSE